MADITPTAPRPSQPPVQGARGATPASAAEIQKATTNAAILQATTAQLSVRDQPLALVLRTAIERLNEILEPEFGPNAIENAVDSGVDYSPEATAERIVGLATGFYGAFQAHNPNDADPLGHFMSVIREGIDRGFAEAREILDGLNVLKGDIASNIDRTYELVQEGLARFEEQMGGAGSEATTPTT